MSTPIYKGILEVGEFDTFHHTLIENNCKIILFRKLPVNVINSQYTPISKFWCIANNEITNFTVNELSYHIGKFQNVDRAST